MIAIGSGQFGQLHSTFSHTQNIRVIYMRLKRKYRVHAFFALIYSEQSCGNLIRRLRADSHHHLRVRSELSARVGCCCCCCCCCCYCCCWSRRRTRRSPVRPSVRPIRRFVHRLIGSRSRPLHVRSFVRSCMSVHLGSFVRASAVHSLFFLWPGFNEV